MLPRPLKRAAGRSGSAPDGAVDCACPLPQPRRMIILGLDPGLASTGWGVIRAEGNRLSHLANGRIATDAKAGLAARLAALDSGLAEIVAVHRPDTAAVEEVFVNANPQSTLKLGQARGVILLGCAKAGLDPAEYAARLVKKAVVGVGGAEKAQVHAMVARLLPGVKVAGEDAADALAVAITHAHHLASARRLA
jgi:crossover junction endodeoxyribonuclease RuvC